MHPVLAQQIKEKSLSHANILVDKDEDFLETQVKEVVHACFGGGESLKHRIEEENHPDFIITQRAKQTITMDSIRQAQNLLRMGPVEEEKRIWWVKEADYLKREGQNVLLKILEEPPDYLIIFLTLPRENILLPTILSRCQVLRYQGLEEDLVRDEVWEALDLVYSRGELGILEGINHLSDLDTRDILRDLSLIFRDLAVYQNTREEKLLKFQPKIDKIIKYTGTKGDYAALSLEALSVREGVLRNVNRNLSLEHIFLLLLEETI